MLNHSNERHHESNNNNGRKENENHEKLINFPTSTFIKRIFYSVFLFSLNAIWYHTICSNGALVCWCWSSSILYVAKNRINDLSQRITRSLSLQTFSEKLNNLNRSDPIEWKLQKQMFPILLRMYIDDVEYMPWWCRWWKCIVCGRKTKTKIRKISALFISIRIFPLSPIAEYRLMLYV